MSFIFIISKSLRSSLDYHTDVKTAHVPLCKAQLGLTEPPGRNTDLSHPDCCILHADNFIN
jgi:hypothetical protein